MQKSPKIPPKYFCQSCDYSTSSLKDYNKHLTTDKHKDRTNLNNLEHISPKYQCEHCNKSYKARNSLWYHKQTCKPVSNQLINKDELILTLLKQLQGQQDIILQLTENGTHSNNNNIHTNNNNNTNSHNKSFNLQFFLNETCKNAMNITDFVDSIKLELSDLMSVGDLGYVEGISKIILNNLNALDETVRPIHCTDKKRETMYIKDQGQWTKEDEKNTKLRKFVNRIADKNIYLLPKFREKYPDYNDSSSKTSDIYDKMVVEVMETCNDKKDKVIKHISRATFIHK
jgi:hypothetical protein